MTLKVCELLYRKGTWSEKICQANCNRSQQLRCDFLEARILEEANTMPAGMVDRVAHPLHPDNH